MRLRLVEEGSGGCWWPLGRERERKKLREKRERERERERCSCAIVFWRRKRLADVGGEETFGRSKMGKRQNVFDIKQRNSPDRRDVASGPALSTGTAGRGVGGYGVCSSLPVYHRRLVLRVKCGGEVVVCEMHCGGKKQARVCRTAAEHNTTAS